MEVQEIRMRSTLERRQQFRIPIYQRRYSWEMGECKKLLDGICEAAGGDDDCFIGTMVSVIVPKGPDEDPVFMVIDGQQRLTTIMLTMAALREALAASGMDEEAEQAGECVHNRHARDRDRYKLVTEAADRKALEDIMDGKDPESCSATMRNNHEYIKRYVAEKGPKKMWSGMKRLTAVNILLKPDNKPQRVFESINSTGKQLTKSDLIRNYVLMDLGEEQNRIYERMWRPLENTFRDDILPDEFVKDFLTIKTGSAVRIGDVYEEFKSWMDRQKGGTASSLEELARYAGFFARIEYWEDNRDDELAQEFEHLDRLGTDVIRPLVMEVMSLNSQGRMTADELREILHMLESYVFRRAVCGLLSAGLNKLIPTIISNISRFKSGYVEGIKRELGSQTYRQRFPDDEEFRERFTTNRIYGTRIAKYVLFRLENHLRESSKNHPPLGFDDEWTIEHILPQNERARAADLGAKAAEEARDHVDRIGNLTITGYNSELADRPFREKMGMEGGYGSSPHLLNDTVRGNDAWGIREIAGRAEELWTAASELWPRGDISAPPGDGGPDDITEEEYFEGEYSPTEIPAGTMDVFRAAKDAFLASVPGLEYKPRLAYLGFYMGGKAVCSIEVQKWCIRVTLNAKKGELEEGPLVRHLAGPDGRIRGHHGTGEFAAWINSREDVQGILRFVRQVAGL